MSCSVMPVRLYLDIWSHSYLQDGGKQLQEGMEENTTITMMDLRLTDCGQESEYCINQRLHVNQERERESQLIDQPLLSKKIKPQAAHRFKPKAHKA